MCSVDISRYGLSRRERQVVEGIARGLEGKEIAREVGITYNTMKMHIWRAKHKMNARNQLEVAILAHGGVPDAHRAQPTVERHIEQAPSWSTERPR